MTFVLTPTPLPGVLVIEVKHFEDPRGFFFESYHQQKLAALGFNETFVQDNHSRSAAGVLRGLHYQDLTAPMGKLVRCTRGVVFDVAVDLRAGSPAFGRWFGLELSETNRRQLWVPVGFGHGFLTLSEWADVQYKCTGFYTPAAEGCLRWDDTDLAITWPNPTPSVSPRDANGRSFSQYRQQPAFHFLAQ